MSVSSPAGVRGGGAAPAPTEPVAALRRAGPDGLAEFPALLGGRLPTRRPAPDEAWLGLGANLGDRLGALRAAVDALPDVVAVSDVWETAPWGIVEQPWFCNAVVRLRWTDDAPALLALCLRTEAVAGRVRTVRNGPRALDLDVLILGEDVLDLPGLTVPHPGIGHRRSVLEPWASVAPELWVPGLGRVDDAREAAAALPGQDLRPLGPLR